MSRKFFNENAVGWDETRSEKNVHKLENLAAALALKPGMTVLDVGSGTGVFLPHILRFIGNSGRVIAFDYAEKMLAVSKSKRRIDNVSYLCGDVTSLPLDDDSCDIVVCYSSFPHFPDKIKALMEIKRVLHSNGSVFVCHTSGRAQINTIHGKVPVLQNHQLPDAIEMEQLFCGAGFAEITVMETIESYFASGKKP